ncbi:MAG: preprotein translocase subunit SecA [Alphaproteobacteria bacterium]|nr:preprotein translocase subunit SecA [Alphaproteobacteria bacterium]
MLLRLATKLFGSSNERAIKRLIPTVDVINSLEAEFEQIDDVALKAKTVEFRERIKNGEALDKILPEAFAVVREASKRVLGMRHFDVQLIGGMVLHHGKIAEMRTGEGKTLVATLAAYLNALSGKGVHVVTVNDYLATRDSQWMGKIYKFLGLSVGCITGNISDEARKAAYAADITYATNNELGFDYLRDNMKYSLEEMAQRPFNFAIVDEVDSILIDEARTPLIISGPSETATDLYVKVDKVIPVLTADDFEKDEKLRTVNLTENGVERVEEELRKRGILESGTLYDAGNIALVHHVNQALRAHKLFSRDTDYIVKDNKVIIIDEFTGRMMEGRRYSEGLHQALEAKENVQIQNENQTLASITFQNFFRLYPKLSGMTGTALTEAAEFADIYRLHVIDIPTNVAVARLDHNDKIYKSIMDKENAIVNLIKEARERKQPVLVGTVSIEKSETLSDKLKKAKIPHQVLNARHHEQESQIIAQAGRPGAVTIATNMAGRGTDIKLGGNLEMMLEAEIDESWSEEKKAQKTEELKKQIEADQKIVLEAGGLYVIGTERHESRRIDNQLRGRSGRQGDPGASMFFLSTQDDLMRIFSPEALEAVLSNKQIGLKDGEALEHPWLTKALERAQTRVEQHNYEIRKTLLKFDDVMNDQRKVIYEQRREIMEAENVSALVDEMRHDVIDALVNRFMPQGTFPEQWDMDGFAVETHRLLSLQLPVQNWAKEEGIEQSAVHERLRDASDIKIQEKKRIAGDEMFGRLEKAIVIQLLDQNWKEHLLNLDHLRTGINLRAFGQKDPLNEFKTEAYDLFENMLGNIREGITQNVCMLDFNIDEETLNKLQEAHARSRQSMQTTRDDPAGSSMPEKPQTVIHKVFDQKDPSTWAGMPRNNPCPCGSGKKYKHCHGAFR